MPVPIPFTLAPRAAAGRSVCLQLTPALPLHEQDCDPTVRDIFNTISSQQTARRGSYGPS